MLLPAARLPPGPSPNWHRWQKPHNRWNRSTAPEILFSGLFSFRTQRLQKPGPETTRTAPEWAECPWSAAAWRMVFRAPHWSHISQMPPALPHPQIPRSSYLRNNGSPSDTIGRAAEIQNPSACPYRHAERHHNSFRGQRCSTCPTASEKVWHPDLGSPSAQFRRAASPGPSPPSSRMRQIPLLCSYANAENQTGLFLKQT